MDNKDFYKKMLKIDKLVRQFIRTVINEVTDEPEVYSYKTEYKEGFYIIHIHHGILKNTVKEEITYRTFFQEICSNEEKLELEMNRIIRKLIIESKDDNSEILISR